MRKETKACVISEESIKRTRGGSGGPVFDSHRVCSIR